MSFHEIIRPPSGMAVSRSYPSRHLVKVRENKERYFGYLLVECGLSSEWIYSNLFMSIFKPLYCNKGDVCVEVLQC